MKHRNERRRRVSPANSGAVGDVSNIYSSPETHGKWHGYRVRSSELEHCETRDGRIFWLVLVRIVSFLIPLGCIFLLVAGLMGWMPMAGNRAVLLYGVTSFMFVLSLVSALGMVGKKGWGRPSGYAVAILLLLVFPLGTLVGLILLVGVSGAGSLLCASPREQRRAARAKRRARRNS